MMAIFGFRSSSKAVLTGMICGFIVVFICRAYIQAKINIDSIILGTIANLTGLSLYHYTLHKSGGWVGIKDPKPLIALRLERKRKLAKLFQFIKNFKLITFLKNQLPTKQTNYIIIGVFIIISNYSSMYTVSQDLRLQHQDLYNFIYHSVLVFSLLFLTVPVWPIKLKNETFVAILWNVGIFYMLIITSGLLVIISMFSQMQLMIFILNLVVVGVLFRWETALFMTGTGVLTAVYFYKSYAHTSVLPNHFSTVLNIIYCLLLFSGVLVAFLKPKQQQAEVLENVKKSLEEQNIKTQFDLIRLYRHREEFMNRLDRRCINVFKEIHKQINNLNQKLLSTNKSIKINNDINLIQVINKLKV